MTRTGPEFFHSMGHKHRRPRNITYSVFLSLSMAAAGIIAWLGHLESAMYPESFSEDPSRPHAFVSDVVQASVSFSNATTATRGDDRLYPLPATGGLVHYTTTSSGGWNNQREGAMMAWVVAYLTGHSLEYKTFHPAFTGVQTVDRGGYSHDDLWDLACLSRYVHVTNISHVKTSIGYEFGFGTEAKFGSLEQVRDLKKYKTISYLSGWSFMQHTFPWLDPWQEPGRKVFQRMMESFTYSRLIQETADKMVSRIGFPYIALHIRKLRPPALDCKELGLETLLNTKEMFQRGACKGLTDWEDAVARLFPNNKLPIYVAHDGTLGTKVLEGARRSSDFQYLDMLRPAIISAVEQEVAIRADFFVASAHSSWSEYVIYKRALTKGDGRRNYDIWMTNLVIMDPPTPV
jgi:hypothetical protein